jgi:hypothetical protein
MIAPIRRIIIEIEGGMVTGVFADGLDLTGVHAFVIDYDTNGAGEGETVPFGKDECFLTPFVIDRASDDMSRDARRAYDTWALT